MDGCLPVACTTAAVAAEGEAGSFSWPLEDGLTGRGEAGQQGLCFGRCAGADWIRRRHASSEVRSSFADGRHGHGEARVVAIDHARRVVDSEDLFERIAGADDFAPAHEVGPTRLLVEDFRSGQAADLSERDGFACREGQHAGVVVLLELAVDVHGDDVGILRAGIVLLQMGTQSSALGAFTFQTQNTGCCRDAAR